jgi:hypothetical protein
MSAPNLLIRDATGASKTLTASDSTGSGGPLVMQHTLVDPTATYSTPAGDAQARAINVLPGDGTNVFKSGAAANVAAKSGANAQLTAPPGNWAASSNPGANTQASASQAAGGSGVRHVCTAVSFSVASDGTAPAATQLVVNLRDGATGAGTVLASWTIAVPAAAGAFASLSLAGLSVVGSANTAMTLEFAAAGGAHTYEACNVFGFDVS